MASQMTLAENIYSSTKAAQVAARILARAKSMGTASIVIIEFPNVWDKDATEQELNRLLAKQGDSVVAIDVADSDEDFFDTLGKLESHQVASIVGLPDSQPELVIRLNWRREFIADEKKRVVLWLNPFGVREFAKVAPDFWAFQNRHIMITPTPAPEDTKYAAIEPESSPTSLPEISQYPVIMAVLVNGKVCAEIEVAKDAERATILRIAEAEHTIAKYLQEGELKRAIVVPRKFVNLIIK